MTIERTLSIIKPDAVGSDHIGEIFSRFEQHDLRIIAARMLQMTQEDAKAFYAVHHKRPFFNGLIDYMISGPVIVVVLEGEDAIARYRALMGATIPKFAVPGSIRYDFARDGASNENAVHGSDSSETAQREIEFFFKPGELCARTR